MTNIDRKQRNIRQDHTNITKQVNWYFLVINQQNNKTVYDKFSTSTKKTKWQKAKKIYNNSDKFAKKAFVAIITTIF